MKALGTLPPRRTAMPRLTDGVAEALGKMCPGKDFSQYVKKRMVLQ